MADEDLKQILKDLHLSDLIETFERKYNHFSIYQIFYLFVNSEVL